MNYYALLVALVLFFALFLQGAQRMNKTYVIVACLLLFFLMGFRDVFRIGNDSTTVYYYHYLRSGIYSWSELANYFGDENMGYYVLNRIIYYLTNGDYQLYIIITSAFVTFCFGRMIYRYSPSPVQSILYHLGLLLYSFHFSGLKQSLAMAVLMLAFDCVVNRHPIKFCIFVVLASQFHLPAICFFPIYWITKLHPGKAYLLVLAAILLLTYVFRTQILSFLLSLYKERDTKVDLSGVQFLRTKALVMIIIVVAAIIFRFPTKEEPIYEVLLEMMGIAIVFQTFCGYSNIFERLADYYFQFSVIFIPMVFDRNTERKSLIKWRFIDSVSTIAPYIFCGFGVYRYLTAMANDYHFTPYRFFFQ